MEFYRIILTHLKVLVKAKKGWYYIVGDSMKYENTVRGRFIDRPNRFIAHVEIGGVIETVHVKNTGRCRELLTPGAEVALQKSDEAGRKTKYDLISVIKPGLGWVNIDSQAPNKVVREWLETQNFDLIRPEYTYGGSRLDFYLERGTEKWLVEVKGCTLEIDGKGYFPDAVSERAARHMRELQGALKEEYHCAVAFVIAMEGVSEVYPNSERDSRFAEAFEEAKAAGVEVWNLCCAVTEDELVIKNTEVL